jgi:WD40 repeat protein
MFGDDDHVVVALGDRGIAVWDLTAGPTILHETTPRGTTNLHDVPNAIRTSSAAFSADGRLLALTAINEDTLQLVVIVWDIQRDKEVTRFDAQEVIGFSPDRSRVATKPFNATGPIAVTDVRTGKTREVSTLPWQTTEERAPKTQHHISASIPSDGLLRLSDSARRQRILDLLVTAAADASALVFSPDGTHLAVTTAGGSFTIVDTDPTSWRSHACSLAARPLTGTEVRVHIGNLDVPDACP